MTWPLIAASLLSVVAWLSLTALYVAASRQVRPLRKLLDESPADGATASPPELSIVVTARDEARDIEATVRHALAQSFPALEVIVVDDRSTDGTAAILDRLATTAGAGRLRVIHVAGLPFGWIGKCHACHVGAEAARGGFLLFMDADVTLASPDLLARIVSWMDREAVDHLALFPDLRPYGALQAGLLHVFEQAMLMVVRAWEMERDRPRGGGGVGAFNLVRRTAYDRVGGHLRLRMEVADDYKLGMLLKESGARQRIYSGMGLVRCPWHRGTLAVLRGLEKNMFSGVDYSLTRLIVQTAGLVTLSVGPTAIALVAGTPSGWAPLAVQAACVLVAAASAARRIDRHPLVLAALYPLSLGLFACAMWNSVVRTLARGGVLWRGSFYPLAALRRGLVRPGDGRRAAPNGAAGGAPAGGAL